MFSPRSANSQHRPSPSRYERWKEELGLDDLGSDNDDIDAEMEDTEVDQDFKSNFSMAEYKALQKELEERNNQRDDLLFQIRTLQEKAKLYKAKLEREESNKRQQLKIMCKTQEANLKEKEITMENLKAFLKDQECYILKLEGKSNKNIDDDARFQHLSQQIEQLQTEKIDQVHKVLRSQTEEENKYSDQLYDLKQQLAKMEKHNQELQNEVSHLKRASLNAIPVSSTQDLQKLESTNDELHKRICELEQTITRMKTLDTNSAHTGSKLRDDNENLKEHIKNLQSRMDNNAHNSNDLQHQHALNLQLTKDKESLEKEIRNLSAKISALQAKSPEVITKIQKVESLDLQKSLDRTLIQMDSLDVELREEQTKHNVTKSMLEESGNTIAKLQKTILGNGLLKKQIEEIKDEKNNLLKEVELLTSTNETLSTDLQKITTDLKNQLEQEQKSAQLKLHSISEFYEDQLKDTSGRLKSVRHNSIDIASKVNSLRDDHENLRASCEKMPQMYASGFTSLVSQIQAALEKMTNHNAELMLKYRKEMKLRKKYMNLLIEIKGNIRVLVRVRPMIKEDGPGSQGAEIVVAPDEDDDSILLVQHKSRVQSFEADKVFSSKVSQQDVFSEVQSLVTSCVDGYNVCIFAYGQTGSGKTFTMEGTRADPGINQRALHQLFDETKERSHEWSYHVSVSMVEIYNEMIRDLLSSDPSFKLDIKMKPDGGGLHVPGLSSIEVSCVKDINDLFKIGRDNRATATTNMNEHSSRSHALLCITVFGTNLTSGTRTMGKLNLVDLAGSERVSKSGADGARLKEAQSINKSLSSLGNVIHSLRNKQSHIPYRNSKLTYLLQESLGGDSKTLMIVQVAPVEKNVTESIASLNFGQRVRSVELGQATRKVEK